MHPPFVEDPHLDDKQATTMLILFITSMTAYVMLVSAITYFLLKRFGL